MHKKWNIKETKYIVQIQNLYVAHEPNIHNTEDIKNKYQKIYSVLPKILKSEHPKKHKCRT